jgi:SNF2 family DNA or RNA helicase
MPASPLPETSLQAFQAGELDVLVLQIDVAGLGLNLQRAGYVVFAELRWTAAAFHQAVARAHRAGQEQHVLAEIVTVPDSLDEAMIRTIRRKAGEARAVFDQPTAQAATRSAAWTSSTIRRRNSPG